MSENGFTLIELISTLVIISVLAAILIPRFIDAETSAKMRGLDVGIAEMNGRETVVWAKVKLSDVGYPPPPADGDGPLWTQLKADPGTDLGTDYDWPGRPGEPNIGGGKLRFKNEVEAQLLRTGSTIETPGKWRRQ